ncbi:MAG: glycosyltransferase family 4 protein [Candidatus Pacebacteria bacterium]|nr:glycosyltransferase family 4 protein [Candidatus Paceibacterota bacterium]
MSTPHTILVVAPYFPPHSGGLERYAYEVATRIQEEGVWCVVVLTTSETGQDVVETIGGITIHRIRYARKLSNSPFSFSWFRSIRRVLREVSPDLVHIHTPVPGLGDLTALLLDFSVPLVVTYHAGSMRKGVWYMDALVWLYEHTMMRALLWRAQRVVCSSDFVRTTFLAQYMHKSETITPAVDSTVFTPRDVSEVEVGVPTMLAVGGLGRGEGHKGLRTLIDILPKVREQAPGTRLMVAGTGDAQDMYEALVIERGLADAVSFLGQLDTHGMMRAYQQADLFVLPTTNDSFPTVILEAMASGMPVVSTRVGSIEDMVEEGVTGFLVEPHDSTALIERIRTLLTDPLRRATMGTAGRARAEECFDWDTASDTYRHVYEEVLHPRPTIAHVVSYYPPHLGGMEVVARELVRELASRRYPVRVYTSRVGAETTTSREVRDQVQVHRLHTLHVAHTPLMWALPFHLLTLPRGSILHVHVAQAFVPEVVAGVAWVRRLPYVAQFHLDVERSGRFGFLFPAYKRYVLGPVLRHANAVLVFSLEQRDFVVHRYGVDEARVHVIQNGVGMEYFTETSRSYPEGSFRLLYVGRLAVQKRVDRLIRAVAQCAFPILLTIVGDGEDRAMLEALATKLCPGRVVFVGRKDPKKVRMYMRKADIFVLPSDKEGMPLVVLEAMAGGLPVVGSDVVGIRELVREVGMVVQNPSPETFATALAEVCGDRALYERMSTQSLACAKEYTWPAVVAELEEVYHEVAGTHSWDPLL